jgi:membrane protease subunit (stomatin/prohibitin family)
MGSFETEKVEDYLREIIVSRLNDYLGETVDSLVNLPRLYDQMAVAVRTRLSDDFHKYGMQMADFYINRITPPEEVQKMIDEKSGMSAVGDLDSFLKFKAAKALGDAAVSGGPAGGAAGGMGLGIGAGMGMMIPGMLYKVLGNGEPTNEKIAQKGTVNCAKCHGEVSLDSRFCPHCGHQMVVIRKCPSCSKDLGAGDKFCPSCGLDLTTQFVCKKCGAKLPPGTRFCFNCGEKAAGE